MNPATAVFQECKETVKYIKDQAPIIANMGVPEYYRIRFDGITNKDHPSIFRLDDIRMPISHTKDCTTTAGRDIVVAAVGPYQQRLAAGEGSSQTSSNQPLITPGKKCGIVQLLRRFGLDLFSFLCWLNEKEALARGCYQLGSCNMNKAAYCRMLLLDSCLVLFAIFLLRSSLSEDRMAAVYAAESFEFHTEFRFLSADILLNMKQTRLDLLMLDNQIPFFVVEELHRRLENTFFQTVKHGIKDMALSCFDQIHPMPRHRKSNEPLVVKHLLHLFHSSRVPGEKHTIDSSSVLQIKPQLFHLPSVSALQESATFFKRKTSGSPLDLSFHSRARLYAIMKIPTLHLCDYSYSIFRSLIAFEQKHLRCGLGATSYSIYMGRLLQTENDAKVLRNERILAHTTMTDKEIVNFFSNLRDEYKETLETKDLLEFYDNVENHHKSWLSTTWGSILLQFFPSKLIGIAVIGGVIVSLVALINNIHSIFRFYHPKKLH